MLGGKLREYFMKEVDLKKRTDSVLHCRKKSESRKTECIIMKGFWCFQGMIGEEVTFAKEYTLIIGRVTI